MDEPKFLKLNHKNLKAWELGVSLVKEIYNATSNFPKTETFGLTNQIRRASVSIVSNISEGASRSSLIERKRFYQIARSSLVELDTQLEISFKLNFLSKDNCDKIYEYLNQVFALLTKMLQSTK
ncbi:MAG TPA: four helix bundle protein [Ignavibacteria bacterium]|nr:four helix bundle protein [Ignavibacteria bacterium]